MQRSIICLGIVLAAACTPKDPKATQDPDVDPYQTRERCLAAPFVPTEFGPLDDDEVYSCGTDRTFVYARAGSQASPELTQTVAVSHIAEWSAIDGVTTAGVGSCCADGRQWPGQCVRLEVTLCKVEAAQLFQKLALSLDADPTAADVEVAFHIEIKGRTGPRCDGGPSCGPVPYSGKELYKTNYQREGIRKVLKEELGSGVCRHDGDCVTAGCGNHCTAWTTPDFVATCEGYVELEPAFCGCVQRSCAWFTQ